MKRSRLPAVITSGVILFLFAPLGVLVVNSFNASRFGGEWEGFTWNWYEKLWAAGEVWESLWITLKIAVSASLAAMVLGTLAAYALHRFRSWLQNVHHMLITLPLVLSAAGIPDPIAAVAIPLLLPVDWLIGRCRAATNVLSDMTVAQLLDRFSGRGAAPQPSDEAAPGQAA